jgi:hypothetical protein
MPHSNPEGIYASMSRTKKVYLGFNLVKLFSLSKFPNCCQVNERWNRLKFSVIQLIIQITYKGSN